MTMWSFCYASFLGLDEPIYVPDSDKNASQSIFRQPYCRKIYAPPPSLIIGRLRLMASSILAAPFSTKS